MSEPKSHSLSLLTREVEQLSALAASARHAVVDGLFAFHLGREVVRGGLGGEVLDALLARQERYHATCLARAAAGRKGGLVGGRATGVAKARFGNQNAKQNAKQNLDEEKTQSKTQSKSGISEEVQTDCEELAISVEKTQSKNAKQNQTQSKTQSKNPPLPPSPPCVPPTTPYNPPSLVCSSPSAGPAAPSREGARTCEGGGVDVPAVEPPSAPEGHPAYLPPEDLQRLYASQIGVPAEYLAEFMAEMERNGWGYVNRGGAFVQLNRQNFKYVLGAFWRTRKSKRRATQPQGVALGDLSGFDFSRFGE